MERGFPGGVSGKEPSCQWRRHKRCRFDPWVEMIPWRRAWQPTLVFLPGESHGQRGGLQATVHSVTQSWTWLKRLSTHACMPETQENWITPNVSEDLTLNTDPGIEPGPLALQADSLVADSLPSEPLGKPTLNTMFAAAAKSLQSCLTLCDPIDGSPPGSPIPGILQARTLEWVAISFSNAWKWKVKVKSLSRIRLLATPWTAAYQAPLSMGFSRQEYWSGVPLPSPNTMFTWRQKRFETSKGRRAIHTEMEKQKFSKQMLDGPCCVNEKVWRIAITLWDYDHCIFMLMKCTSTEKRTKKPSEYSHHSSHYRNPWIHQSRCERSKINSCTTKI